MNPAIVVVFSLTGNTRRVGAEIARRLGCPIAEITETRVRSGALGYLRSGFEALSGRIPEIAQIDRNFHDFSLLLVGSPVWVGHVSSPVRSFLSRHRREIGSLGAFCTMGGRDPANIFTDIASITSKPLVATLAISKLEPGSPRHGGRLDEFIAAVRSLKEGG